MIIANEMMESEIDTLMIVIALILIEGYHGNLKIEYQHVLYFMG